MKKQPQIKLDSVDLQWLKQLKRKWKKRSIAEVIKKIREGYGDVILKKKQKGMVETGKTEGAPIREETKEVPHGKSDLEEKEEQQLEFLKAHKCPNCMSLPFRDKNERLRILCTRPIFKQNRYGNWVPSGKEKGEIPLESCMSTLKYLLKKEQAKEEKVDVDSLKTIIKEQSEKLTKYHEKEADQTQRTLESMQKGESIICRLKNRHAIPLWKCFEMQDEQKEIPQHFLLPNERCPCGKFIHLERIEMWKYQNAKTVPFIDSEIRRQYLENIENVEEMILELKGIDNYEERKQLIDGYYNKHPIFEGYEEKFKKTMDICKKLDKEAFEKDLAQHHSSNNKI